MEDKVKKLPKERNTAEFDVICACGSGEIAGACCKSNELCPCGSGDKAGECCYAPEIDEEE